MRCLPHLYGNLRFASEEAGGTKFALNHRPWSRHKDPNHSVFVTRTSMIYLARSILGIILGDKEFLAEKNWH